MKRQKQNFREHGYAKKLCLNTVDKHTKSVQTSNVDLLVKCTQTTSKLVCHKQCQTYSNSYRVLQFSTGSQTVHPDIYILRRNVSSQTEFTDFSVCTHNVSKCSHSSVANSKAEIGSEQVNLWEKIECFSENKQRRMINTLNNVVDALLLLEGTGHENVLNMFVTNISKNVPAVGSPSFNLIADQLKFFSLENTSAMRYSFSTKCVFKVAKGLFGGAALRFLSGWKNEMQLKNNNTNAGYFNPSEARSLLAVPSEKVLDQFQPLAFAIPKRIKPGIMYDLVNLAIKSTPPSSSLVLKFDGRRLRPGFEDEESGDVDLGGYESGLSLPDQVKEYKKLVQIVKNCIESSLSQDNADILSKLKNILQILNTSALELKCKQNQLKKSLAEKYKLAGKDWMHSKYKKLISYLNGLIRKSSEVLQRSMSVRNSLSAIICTLQESDKHWTDMPFVPLESVQNCWILKDTVSSEPSEENFHISVKQRSEKWHQRRQTAYVTGSTLYQAAGLDSVQSRLSLYDKVHLSIAEKSHSSEVLNAMQYGTDNEINAVAAVCTKVLPVYFPSLDFVEVGIFRYPNATTKHSHDTNGKCCTSDRAEEYCLFSLDGVFVPHTSNLKELNENEICMTTEIKCPYFKQECHTEVPVRYFPQIQAGMAVTNTPVSLYVSYTPETTSVFLCKRDEILFDALMLHIKDTFVEGKRKLKSADASEIKLLNKKSHAFVEYVAEVKSVKVSQTQKFSENPNDFGDGQYKSHINEPSFFGTKPFDPSDVKAHLLQTIEILRDSRQIQRVRATESVTYMVSNTDRVATNDRGHGVQIGYVLSGSSFPEKDVRSVTDRFYMETEEKGGHVAAIAFDGQFHKLLNTSNAGQPLTIFQLQKQCWEEVHSMSKSDLISYIENTARLASTYQVSKSDNTALQVSCPFLSQTHLMLHRSIFNDRKSVLRVQEISETGGYENADNENSTTADEILASVEVCSGLEGNCIQSEHVSNDINNNEFDSYFPASDNSQQEVEKIVILPEQISGLHVFLHQSSKFHSFSDVQLYNILLDACELNKLATVSDLKCIIKWLKVLFKENQNVANLKLSGRKYDLVMHISTLISSCPFAGVPSKSIKKKSADSLYNLSLKTVKNMKKSTLNIIVSHCQMIEKYENWKSNSPINFHMSDFPGMSWCSVPEVHSETSKLLLHFIDYHHINIRIRMSLIKDNFKFVSLKGWKSVSEMENSPLPIPVLNGIDPQSESFAQQMFSQDVETLLKSQGFYKESEFCSLVRGYMEANDMPGITAEERHTLRFALRNYLLQWVDIFAFPPPGDNVMGMPFQLFEAIVTSADSFLQLHALVPSSCYNVRAISTNDNETLHGIEEAMLKPFGGVPSVKQLEVVKARTVEISAILNSPDIDFPIRHAKTPVYFQVDYLKDSDSERISVFEPPKYIEHIEIKDHFFDKRESNNKRKVQTISNWWRPPKGVPGIRKLYKANEMRLTLCERMGYSEQCLNV